jgi:hypothetical protein
VSAPGWRGTTAADQRHLSGPGRGVRRLTRSPDVTTAAIHTRISPVWRTRPAALHSGQWGTGRSQPVPAAARSARASSADFSSRAAASIQESLARGQLDASSSACPATGMLAITSLHSQSAGQCCGLRGGITKPLPGLPVGGCGQLVASPTPQRISLSSVVSPRHAERLSMPPGA